MDLEVTKNHPLLDTVAHAAGDICVTDYQNNWAVIKLPAG
jgi:hypothetical protein